MAVSPRISSALPAIAFSKNDLYLVVESNAADYLPADPAIAVNYYQFEAAVAAAATVDITWALNGVTMTAADDPNGSGFQFPTGDGGADYVTSLVPYFQANNFIDDAFTVSVDTTGEYPRLIFTAKQVGAGYNAPAGEFGGNITPGADNTPVANFAHHIEVWIDDGTGNFVQVWSANVPLDMPLNGKTSVDLHDSLHSFLSPDYPVMDAAYEQCIESIRQYYIKYAQFFGDIPAIQAVKYSSTPVITYGGLGMQPSLLRDIFAELCPGGDDLTQNRFLRQGSKNKLVTKDQPEWLTYINLEDGEAQSVYLEVTVNNSDSSTLVFNAVSNITIQPYTKYQFQAGFTQLGIPGRQSLDLLPVYYTCRLKVVSGDGWAYVTDSYNYVIDYQYREFPRYFVYFNSYGAFQTLATVGKGQLEYDRTKDDAQLSVDRATAAMDGDFLECNITIQDKGTVNIGYDRAGTRNTMLLRDLLLSRANYLYQDGVLIPIGWNTKNLKDALDGVNVYANQIEFYYLYEEEVWTEDPQPDDDLTQLIIEAGSPVPNEVPPVLSDSGTIIVEYGDTHLSIVGGNQVYTAPYWLAGKTGYRVYSTEMGVYFRSEDLTYNSAAGSFTIVVPGFVLTDGDQLIIFPFILNPDS